MGQHYRGSLPAADVTAKTGVLVQRHYSMDDSFHLPIGILDYSYDSLARFECIASPLFCYFLPARPLS